MQEIKISELKPHPKNDYFFDDIIGDNWDAFLESIKTSGVIEPIVVSQDKIIVSGHQRIRACKELGIDTAMCDIRIYENEDMLLKDLLETNIRQRGIGNPNPVKLGRCIKELERIYGIHNGGDRGNQYKVAEPNNSDVPTQSDLASMVGISVDTLNNYKKLTELIPEIVDLIDTGIVTPTTALAIAKNMKPEEQEEFINGMDATKKITQKEVKKYIEENKALQKTNDELNKKLVDIKKYKDVIDILKKQQEQLNKKYITLQEQKNQTTIVTQEVDSKKTIDELAECKEQLKKKNSEIEKYNAELFKKQKKLNEFMGSSTNFQLVSKCSEITLKMLNFVKDMGIYDYLAESFNEIPDATRNEYMKSVKAVYKWAERILDTVEENNDDYIDSDIIDEDNEEEIEEKDSTYSHILDPIIETNEEPSDFDKEINKILGR